MTRNIVAILRGVRPDEVEEIGAALIEAGIDVLEVPLNSPRPFDSIARLASRFGARTLIGAGTVTSTEAVDRTEAAGARLVVSPDCHPPVIVRTLELGMVSMPGVFTATECFTAIRHGARKLKLFPAGLAGPEGVRALKAVLPADVELHAVGGASAANVAGWVAAGVDGFGIGTALYKPGWPARTVFDRASEIVAACDRAFAAASGHDESRKERQGKADHA